MIASGGSTPPTPDPGDLSRYVQDGLVLHLDGINKGGTSGRWSSLVGSEYYTLTNHSVEETNALRMDGSGVISSTNTATVNYSSGTIEVCAEYLGTGAAVVMYAVSNGLAFIIGGSGYCFGIGSSNNQWNLTKESIFTVSLNSSRCVLNGSTTGTLIGSSWTSNISTNEIGGRSPYANPYYANIRIYSIRKYNRILTEAEMLQNQAVDNARFNLGLNI